MTTQKLMLGNYISFSGVMCVVDEIHRDYYCVRSVDKDKFFNHTFKSTSNELKYVPLTQDWLNREAFSVRDRKTNSHKITLSNNTRIVVKDNMWVSEWGNVELKYAHQLQNLITILTDKTI